VRRIKAPPGPGCGSRGGETPRGCRPRTGPCRRSIGATLAPPPIAVAVLACLAWLLGLPGSLARWVCGEAALWYSEHKSGDGRWSHATLALRARRTRRSVEAQMSRRIELPDEFAFGDGTRVGRPADLAARIEAELYRESELWQRLEDGDFLRWLQQGGWESLIQRLEQFRQHSGGKDVLEFLEILRQDSGIRGPNQATSTEGRGPTFPAGSSLRSPESQPVRKRALAARPSAGEVQPNRTKYYARSALLMRQVEAPRPFVVRTPHSGRRSQKRIKGSAVPRLRSGRVPRRLPVRPRASTGEPRRLPRLRGGCSAEWAPTTHAPASERDHRINTLRSC
jgi:hypothetical protein